MARRDFWVSVGPRDISWKPVHGSHHLRITNICIDESPFDDLVQQILPSIAASDGYENSATIVAYAVLPALPPCLPDPSYFECTSNKGLQDNIALLPRFPVQTPIIGGHLKVSFWYGPSNAHRKEGQERCEF